MSEKHFIGNSLVDDQSRELNDIAFTLSKLYERTFVGTQSYFDGLPATSVISEIQQLIKQSRLQLRTIAGLESLGEFSPNYFFVDDFVNQAAKTIGIFVGLHKKLTFDLCCPTGFVGVPSEDLLLSIMTIATGLRTTVHGQGNIVIKTRYYQDMLDGPEFADLSIHDDGVWIEPDPISPTADNMSGRDTHTRHDFQSIQNFLEENRIKLLVNSGPEFGTTCTLRIPIAGRSNNLLEDEARSGPLPVNGRWSIQLLTMDEAFRSDVFSALAEAVDDISVFSCMNDFSEYNRNHKSDIIVIDDKMFSDIKIETIIQRFYHKQGQLIIFTSIAPDPALIPSGVMVMLKPVNQGILKPTIAAVKLVRLSNI